MAVTITWNGDTSVNNFEIYSGVVAYKVSDKFYSITELENASAILNGTSYSCSISQDNGIISINLPDASNRLVAMIFNIDDVSSEVIDAFGITESGTYFVIIGEEYISSLTLPNANEEATPLATIEYNGETIAQLNAGETATLSCEGKKMASDVVVKVAEKIDGAIITSDGQYFIVKESE